MSTIQWVPLLLLRPVPEVAPFRGFLYDRELVPRLEDVTAPPYDVVDEDQRQALLQHHQFNACHLDLGDPDETGDQYGAARRRYEAWTARGILRRDPEPRLYLYRMGFRDDEGRARQTSGVVTALRLEEPGSGVLPHERTLPKPLGDRLHLLRACPVNLSPIYLLSPVEGLTDLLEPEGPPRAACTDPDGVHHRLYDITATGRMKTIAEAVGSAPLVIADGHHRYQTALAYWNEIGDAMPGAEWIMALIVELSPDQLQVEPIHRVLGRRVAQPAGEPVEPTPATGSTVVTTADRAVAVVAPAGVPPVCHLHDELLPALGVSSDDLEYEPSAERAAGVVARGGTAFLLPPLSVEEIATVAKSGERFPQKSTYFAPKPRTGLVFRSLRES